MFMMALEVKNVMMVNIPKAMLMANGLHTKTIIVTSMD